MGDFFRGWRRKSGIVTLVLACVFFVGWMRCLLHHRYWEDVIRGHREMLGINTPVETSTPDYSVVSVLTLLSAYLLLSKPRNRKPRPTQV